MFPVKDESDPVGARREEWVAAVNDRSLDRYEDLVTDNLVWLPPFGEPIEGRRAFRAWLEPFFERYTYDFALTPVRVSRFDVWCAEIGHFRSALAPQGGGEARAHEGSYFVLWRLDEDGRWRIERYVDGIGVETPDLP